MRFNGGFLSIGLVFAVGTATGCAETRSASRYLSQKDTQQGDLVEITTSSESYTSAMAILRSAKEGLQKETGERLGRLALWSSDYKSNYANRTAGKSSSFDKTYTSVKIDWRKVPQTGQTISVVAYEADVPNLPETLSRDDLNSANTELAVDFLSRLTSCRAIWAQGSGQDSSFISITRAQFDRNDTAGDLENEETLASLDARSIQAPADFFAWVNENLGRYCAKDKGDSERVMSYIASLNGIIAADGNRNTSQDYVLEHKVELEGQGRELKAAVEKAASRAPSI